MEQFATFDAAKAQCFLASDRERLLAVIEASFGEITQASTGWHAMSSRSVHASSLKWNLSRRHEHQTCLSPLFARLLCSIGHSWPPSDILNVRQNVRRKRLTGMEFD
eukprot:scaffold63493_cov69-Phaeocystis_antarctica.AAC.8